MQCIYFSKLIFMNKLTFQQFTIYKFESNTVTWLQILRDSAKHIYNNVGLIINILIQTDYSLQELAF